MKCTHRSFTIELIQKPLRGAWTVVAKSGAGGEAAAGAGSIATKATMATTCPCLPPDATQGSLKGWFSAGKMPGLATPENSPAVPAGKGCPESRRQDRAQHPTVHATALSPSTELSSHNVVTGAKVGEP